jgi:hypothetical protein
MVIEMQFINDKYIIKQNGECNFIEMFLDGNSGHISIYGVNFKVLGYSIIKNNKS